jgi:photosystem II stability/assembly factor-like uncharacterized protein
MKKTTTLLSILFLIVLCSKQIKAQPWNQQIDSNKVNNFFDIQKAFENYWTNKTIEKGKGYNTFKRWENFWEQRVGATGIMPPNNVVWTEWNSYLVKQRINQSLRGAFDSGNWVNLGPNQTTGGYNGLGRINCITFHPTDSNIFWIGTPAGGLWVTKDFGKTWTSKGDKLPSMGVSDIIIDYTNPNVMYIATGDRDFGSFGGIQGLSGTGDTKSIGVMKSTDGGSTWRVLSNLSFTISNMDKVNRLIMHPTNNKLIYAATSKGIYITNDSGATWTIKKAGYYIDMEINPKNPNMLYATSYSSSAQIFRTKDGGTVWTQVTSLSGVGRINVELTKANAAIVIAVGANASDEGLNGIYKSTDSGATFSLIFNGGVSGQNLLNSSEFANGVGGQGWYDLSLAIHPNNANIVFLGGVNTWLSESGGTSWNINSYWSNSTRGVPTVHADKHYHAFHPLSKVTNGTIFECNDGGVYYSKNKGSNWVNSTNGLAIGQIYRIALSNNGSLMLAGHQDNGTMKSSSGAWTNSYGGDGMNCQIDQSNSNYMYAGVQNGKIIRSSDAFSSGNNNVTISDNISGIPRGAWVTPYVLDPTNTSTIVAGYADVYKSTNRGNAWTKISTNLTGSSTNYLRSIAIAPSNSNVIYAATYYNIWKTTNGGSNWITVKNGLPSSSALTYICVHPTDPNIVWITYSGYDAGKKIYKTIDGGTSWTNISGTLPNLPVNCIVHEKNSIKNNLYIGTDVGIFVRNDAFGDWVYFSRNLPNVPVAELEINYQGQKIVAGTHGRGLWQSNLWSATPPPSPKAILTADDTTICQGGNVLFSSKSTNTNGVSWIFQGGIPSTSLDTIPSVLYTNAGTFKVTLIANGSGGIDTLIKDKYITVYPLPTKPSISQDTNKLIASADTMVQWILNGNAIAGANSKILLAKVDGSYRVEYTDSNGCKSISAPFSFKYTRVGLESIYQSKSLKIWPNPTEGVFSIESLNQNKITQIKVIDFSGKSIINHLTIQGLSNSSIDISNAEKGLYIVEITMNDGSIGYGVVSKL